MALSTPPRVRRPRANCSTGWPARRYPVDTRRRPVRRGTARLQLLRILVGEPNVLFLGEPHNDLDVDTLTELEDLLDGPPGSLVLVSHDRYFLERVTGHVVALLGGGNLSICRAGWAVPPPPPRGCGWRRRCRWTGGWGCQCGHRKRAAAGASQAPPQAPALAPPRGAASAPAPSGGAGAQRATQKEMARLEHQDEPTAPAQEDELTTALAEHATDYIPAHRTRRRVARGPGRERPPGGAVGLEAAEDS